jgi:hypothetical protein
VAILVPIIDARVGPDHAIMFRIHPRIIFIMSVLADFHSALSRLDESHQTLGNVARLALDVEDQAAAVTQIGIGAIEKKQIGRCYSPFPMLLAFE